MNSKIQAVKKYILGNYPKVSSVETTTKIVHLGSGPNEKGEAEVEQIVFLVTIDNTDDDLHPNGITIMSVNIYREVDKTLGLGIDKYGSKYDIEFYVLSKMRLRDYLIATKNK